MRILGIHDGHNSSAALVDDGVLIAAVQEERLTRRKNQGGFPTNAVREVLGICNLAIGDIDQVAFSGYGKSNVKTREDVLANYLRKIERKKSFLKAVIKAPRGPTFFKEAKKRKRLRCKQRERKAPLLMDGLAEEKIKFVEHHLCHASAAYFGQGNMEDEILVLTCDAAGDGICASVSIGKKGKLRRLTSVPASDSVPIFYSLLTFLMGFVPLEHEYKLMGLAPYSFGSARSQEVCDYLRSHFTFTAESPLWWRRVDGVVNTFKICPQLKEYIKDSVFI